MSSFTVCVFCGSRNGHDEDHSIAAHQLGAALAYRGWSLIYGGGNIGLMGTMARSALVAGGEVIGVIPRSLLEVEVGLRDATELIVTDTLRIRKAIMDERSDAFMALPGGFGTLEELLEVLTLRQLHFHNKPIIIVNLNNFFDPLINLFEHLHRAGYVEERQLKLFEVVESIDGALRYLDAVAEEKL